MWAGARGRHPDDGGPAGGRAILSLTPFAPGLLGRHKTASRLALDLAREEARAAGADEALLVSPAGEALEGAARNLFVGRAGGERARLVQDARLVAKCARYPGRGERAVPPDVRRSAARGAPLQFFLVARALHGLHLWTDCGVLGLRPPATPPCGEATCRS